MNIPKLESTRITLRPFHETDMEALHSLVCNPMTFSNLPWVSATSLLNAENFCTQLMDNDPFFFIITMKNNDLPIGFIKVSTTQSHLMDVSLLQEYWHRDVMIEAFQLLQPFLIEQGIPNIFMKVVNTNEDICDFTKRTGFMYEYSYESDKQRIIRLYQKILIPEKARFTPELWAQEPEHFIETIQ